MQRFDTIAELGNPIIKTFNGDKKKLMKGVLVPPAANEI